jgi:hypothetical protein
MHTVTADSLATIDAYLASFIRESRERSARLAAAGVSESELNDVRKRSEQAGLNRPSLLTRSTLLRFFGQPAEQSPDALIYDLRLWPEHRFRFKNNGGGIFGHEGFERRQAYAQPSVLRRVFSELREGFRPWYHTAADVAAVLGSPDLDLGWGSVTEWHFRGEHPGEDTALSFDFGLLQAVSPSAGAIEKYREPD